jgi:triphosphatase
MIAVQREASHRALMRMIDEGPFGATAIATQRLAMRLFAARPSATVDDCARRWLEKQRDRVVERARLIAVLDHAARHRLRVEVKRLRYALDLLEPLYDDATVAPFHDALADLQDRLGRLNDAVVAQTLLRSLPPSASLELVLSRYDGWLARHVRKQLPKVGALSVAFELTPQPWKVERSPAFG